MSKAGFTTYVFKSRTDAANFAAQVSNAQNEAHGKKAGLLAVGWAKLKSGLTRQVKIPSSTTVAELSAMKSVVTGLQELEEKKLCTRKASAYDLPPDFQWSRGDAKNMSRHIVVRHWTTPGKKDSSLHTALSMKDKIAGVNDYATWTPMKIRFTKWSHSKNPLKRWLAPVKMKLEDLFSQDFPGIPSSYREEKSLYLRTDTKFRLQKGVESRELMTKAAGREASDSLANRNVEATSPEALLSDSDSRQQSLPGITDSTVKAANYAPLPFQKTSGKNNKAWQRRAEKHYLPCVGFDKHRQTNHEIFIMFGLNLDKMREHWEAVKNSDHPEHYYKQFSKEQNCSGMCLSLLKTGGADLFHRFSPSYVTTQSDMEKYSAKLLETFDQLNTYADELDDKVAEYGVPNEPKLSLSSVCEKLELLPKTYSMPDEWAANIQEVVTYIKAIESCSDTIESLTPVAAKLTSSLAKLFTVVEKKHPYLTDRLEPALHAFKILKNKMEDAYKEQIEMYEDPYYE